MKKVIILSGISGSGKSTYAKKLVGDSFGQEECTGVVVCSADHFFMQTGEYKFDASMLSLAHGECFKDFIEEVQRGTSLVLVDNTNTSVAEIAPYVLGGPGMGVRRRDPYDARSHGYGISGPVCGAVLEAKPAWCCAADGGEPAQVNPGPQASAVVG